MVSDHGLEGFFDISDWAIKHEDHMWEKIKSPGAIEPDYGVSLRTLELRCIMNPHRNLQTWGIKLVGITEKEYTDEFDEHPSKMKKLLKTTAHKIYG